MKLRGSLFGRIFLGFWLALTLIGACAVALTVTTDSGAAERKRHQQEIESEGRVLVDAYLQGGTSGLDRRRTELLRKTGQPVYLSLRGEGIDGAPLPPRLLDLARQAWRTDRFQLENTGTGLWAAVPSGGDFIYLRTITPPGPLERMFDPHRLASRLIVTFLISGAICFALARSLTAPLQRLRDATRRFADGDLTTRLGDVAGADEISALSRDFDAMAERIEQLVASQRTLLRDISHELRSPLTRLAISLELARRDGGNAAAPALDRIEQEAGRLNELIGQLTTLTLLESGSATLPQDDLDLGRLLAEIVADADFEASSRGRRCELLAGHPAVALPAASRELLKQALENVIRNAVRHTAPGSTVTVSLAAVGRTATIAVCDRGPGVPPEYLETIFLPFVRVEGARDRQSGGSGVGLAIAERAVRLHGGRIAARNRPEGGLCVEITLPSGIQDKNYLFYPKTP